MRLFHCQVMASHLHVFLPASARTTPYDRMCHPGGTLLGEGDTEGSAEEAWSG
jgi:hypothetical protein